CWRTGAVPTSPCCVPSPPRKGSPAWSAPGCRSGSSPPPWTRGSTTRSSSSPAWGTPGTVSSAACLGSELRGRSPSPKRASQEREGGCLLPGRRHPPHGARSGAGQVLGDEVRPADRRPPRRLLRLRTGRRRLRDRHGHRGAHLDRDRLTVVDQLQSGAVLVVTLPEEVGHFGRPHTHPQPQPPPQQREVQPPDPARQPGGEGQLPVVVPHPAEAGDQRDPGPGQ